MSLADSLTPKDTEEVRPGLFVQRRKNKYRKIEPLAWNGKLRVKEQLKTIFSLRTMLSLVVILFIIWSYQNDVKQYKEFYEEVRFNPHEYCRNVDELSKIPVCTDADEQRGLCNNFNWGLDNGEGSNVIPINP